MATSGSTTVKVTNWNSLKFSWEIASQSIAQNTSTVNWKLELIATSDGYISSSVSKAGSVSIDSNTVSQFTAKIGINNNSTKTLASGTRTITHAADGTKTSTYRFQMEFNITFDGVYIGTVSGGGAMELKTIHRASQPSCITWPEHTQDVGEFGDTISIHMNRASSALTHTVRYQFGEQKGTIATNVGTGTTWTIPLSLMNLIPNSLSGSGTIYVDTYVGTELVGTKYCGFTATVPASVKPTCTLSLEDVAGIDDIYGSPVQGLSRIRATINPTLAYSSPIASYSITIDGVTSASSATTTAPLRNAGASPVTVKITDRRGRSASASYTMNVQAYNPPSLSQLAVHRCDADGTENPQGEYIKATFAAAVTSLNKKNTATYTIRYKKTTVSNYTEVVISALKNVYTVTGQTYIFAADGSSSYDVELEVADRHDAASRATSASTAFTLINWGADGKSMAIGKVVEKPNTFEVALDAEFSGATITRGNSYSSYAEGTPGVKGYVAVAQIEITHTNANAPITFYLTRRNADSTMTVHVRFTNVATLTPGIDRVTYEGENYGAFMYQTSDSAWVLYVEKTAQNDPITVQRWTTSPFMDGRIKVGFPSGLQVDTLPNPYYRATPAQLQSLLDYIYPVGSIYMSYSHASPATMFGGTWVRIENAFLWGVDSSGTIGLTGGAKEVALSTEQIPAHSHGSVYSQHAAGTKNAAWYTTSGTNLAYGTVETGGGKAHNNMPPYIQVSIWRRTA